MRKLVILMLTAICLVGCEPVETRMNQQEILNNCLYRAKSSDGSSLSGDTVLACAKVAREFGKDRK